MLQTGTKAPEFTLPDQNGELHSLKDYRGKRVLLYFYPGIIHRGVQSRLADTANVIRSLKKKAW